MTDDQARIAEQECRAFLRLARIGKRNPGASTSEHACKTLAQVILKEISSLDDMRIAGLKRFIDLAKAAPETARSLFED